MPSNRFSQIVLVLALAASSVGAVFVTDMVMDMNREIAKAEEAARPAKLSIVKITAPDCADCFNVEAAVGAMKSQQILVAEERAVAYDSEEGKRLIAEHEIASVPTFLAFGEAGSEKISAYVAANGVLH